MSETSVSYANNLSSSLNKQKILSDELREKNWDLNKTKMNSNLNELIKTIKNKKSSPSELNKSREQDDDGSRSPARATSSNILDENSSTAEFRKYLEDLKKSYLEKLTFSCPSKLSHSLNLPATRKTNIEEMRSSENIVNLLSNSRSMLSDSTNARRSLLYDYNKNDNLLEDKVKYAKSNLNLSSRQKETQTLPLSLLSNYDKENFNDSTATISNNMMLMPDLTKTQMLSRLIQIREYLKQAYTMLATLQTSNDLTNYASQMNKLHSLIDHLKEQEKGYMDLLESFHELTNSISLKNKTGLNNSSENNNQTKDALDLSELNDSTNQSKQTTSKLATTGYSTLSSATNKRIMNQDDLSLNTNFSSNDSNSISGSFISDTLTLNCITSNNNQNELAKYNNNNKKNPKSSLNKSNNYEDEKTDNDQDILDEFEDGDEFNELNNLDLIQKQTSIREQRQEIFKELDNDMVTLEQLREQKQLLRSIRLRKEELKALEGRRKALEALKKIASDGENELDQAFDALSIPADSKVNNAVSANQVDHEEKKLRELEEFNSFLTMLKEKKKSINNSDDSVAKIKVLSTFNKHNESLNDEKNVNKFHLTDSNDNLAIEASTQIEKSKKTVKHYEEMMSRNSQNNSIINDTNVATSGNMFDEFVHQKELSERMTSLAENEKKLEELYAMQNRLSQLKQVINHFNDLKELKQSQIESKNKSNLQANSTLNDSTEIDNANCKRKDEKEETNEDESDPDKHLQLEEHKKKLSNAKEKLKQLQDLISRLQLLSASSQTEKKLHQDDIEEEDQEEEVNNDINDDDEKRSEVSSQMDKLQQLEDLKQNRQKLIDLLKEKENESSKLAKVYMSLRNKNLSTKSESTNTLNEEEEDEEDDDEENCNQNEPESSNTAAADSLSNDLENKFDLAEDDFDELSLDNVKSSDNYKHSPSDYLWLEMKKQLNMRETLRNKKKELEDLINNENSKTNNLLLGSYLLEKDPGSTSKELIENVDDKDYYEESDNNDIINGYREFFLRKKHSNVNQSADSGEQKQSAKSDAKNTSATQSQSPRIVRQKQENLCSTDELIKEEILKNEKNSSKLTDIVEETPYSNAIYSMSSSYKYDDSKVDGVLIKSFPEFTSNPRESSSTSNLASLHDLNQKMDKFMNNQQQLNESMQKSFQELLTGKQQQHQSFSNSNLNSSYSNGNNENQQIQLQTQMQIQQLMFNLNAAYHEISTQRSEMAALKENLKQTNSRIDELTKTDSSSLKHNEKSFNSIGTLTDNKEEDDESTTGRHPRSRSVSTNNALPSYFYNRRSTQTMTMNNTANNLKSSSNVSTNKNMLAVSQSTTRHEAYYTDDFEEDDEERKSNSVWQNLNTNNNNNNNKKKISSTSLAALNNHPNLNLTRTFSNHSSEDSCSLQKFKQTSSLSSDSTSSPSSSIKNLSQCSSTSSTFALRNNSRKTNALLKTKSASLYNRSSDLLKRMQQALNNNKGLKDGGFSSENSTSRSCRDTDTVTFDKMREKIYSEVATLISKNEKRPVWLLNVFKELQYLNDKSSRDQALKSIFNISNRHLSTASSSSGNLNTNNPTHSNSNQKNSQKSHEKSVEKKENEQNYDDNDDVITYNYRMKNMVNKDDDSSSQTNPFECDSLSNTVIFVRNSPQNGKLQMPVKKTTPPPATTSVVTQQKSNQLSSKFTDEKASISEEVKVLISKIIAKIKFSNDFDDSDEDGDSSDSNKRLIKCDSSYLNNIIEKVMNVLRQSNKHFDYLRLYQSQLACYLREALAKYENKTLISCMEEILIDISDILYNELTFYSIMNNSKLIKYNPSSSKNQSTSSMASSLNNSSEDKEKNNLNLIKSLSRFRNYDGRIQNETSSATTTTNDETSRSNSLTTNESSTGEKIYYFDNDSQNDDLEDDDDDDDDNNDDAGVMTRSFKASDQIGKNAKASLDLLNRFKYLFKEKNFNYLKTYKDDEIDSCLSTILKTNVAATSGKVETNSSSSETDDDDDEDEDGDDDDDDDENEENEEKISEVKKNEMEEEETNLVSLTCKVLDINDLKLDEVDDVTKLLSGENNNNEEITIDDLPTVRLNNDANSQKETYTVNLLDDMIMNSISDELVGNPEELPPLVEAQNQVIIQDKKNEPNEQITPDTNKERKSESSNSDHFVIIGNGSSNGSNSDPEIVDVKNTELNQQAPLDAGSLNVTNKTEKEAIKSE